MDLHACLLSDKIPATAKIKPTPMVHTLDITKDSTANTVITNHSIILYDIAPPA